MNAKGKHEGFKPVFRHLTGGLDIAASWAGITPVAFCEIEPYAVKVLERRFQGIENHGDITRFTNRTLRELGGSPFHRFKCPADYNGTIGVVHGGFPCQDLSVAGKQAGLSGERSGLWFEMLRVISECRPRYVVAENVRGAVNLALDTVCFGLGDEGYEVRPIVLPASAVGAPHQRERLFVLGVRQDVADRLRSRSEAWVPGQEPWEEGNPAEPVNGGSPSGSLWPTPSVHGNYNRKGLNPNSGDGLATAVKMWPTPHRNCSNGAGAHGDGGLNLQTAVKAQLWPTPCSRGDTQGGPVGLAGGTRSKQKLDDHVGVEMRKKLCSGQLSPLWVECLMGYPLGWTDVDCDEPEPWPGWPALMGEKLWKTPAGQEPGINPERLTGDLGHRMYDKDTGRHAQYGVSQQVKIIESAQYPYEPPRTVVGCKNRAKRLKCLGNSVVPQQAYPIFRAIAEMEAMTK